MVAVFSACGQDINTYSGDNASLKIDCTAPANANLCVAANGLLQAQCYSCHSPWLAYETSQDYIDAGLISSGNTAGSKIYQHVVNTPGGDMPPSGTPLSAATYQSVIDWINSP